MIFAALFALVTSVVAAVAFNSAWPALAGIAAFFGFLAFHD